MEYYYNIRLYFQHFFDQPVLAFGQLHGCSVIPFRLKYLRQPGKDYRDVCFCSSPKRFFQLLFRHRVIFHRKSFCISHATPFFSGSIQCRNNPERIDMAGAAALIPRLFGKFPYIGNLSVCIQRKYTVIFQQDRTFRLNISCFFMICFLIRYNFRTMLLFTGKYNIQYPLHRFIQHSFVQSSLLYCFHNLSVIVSSGIRHLQIQSGLQSFHTVIYSAPVTDDAAFVSPFFSQDICQKISVFRSIFSIYFVVATHDGSWS